MSNNVAECAGLIAVVYRAWSRGFEILVKGDSRLVINQMFGTWKIKEGLYIELAHRAREAPVSVQEHSGRVDFA